MIETYTLLGQCRSGKNAMQITRWGGHYAKPEFKKWRADWQRQLMEQRGLKKPIDTITTAIILYTPGDLRRRDAPGIQDALWHLLEYCKVIKDDALIKTVLYEQQPLDRKRPRIYLSLKPENSP